MKVDNYNKKNKGITLIALIITIIVLLILAGVTLSFVMQGGILDKSQLAVNEYQKAANDEDNTLKNIDEQLDKQMDIYENGGVDMDKVKEDFEKDPEKYKHPDQSDTNGDRAVGTDGNPVNMDLWDGWQKEEDGAHLDWYLWGSGAGQKPFYLDSNLEGGKIKGTVPQYIYSEEDGNVYPVVSMEKTFQYSDIEIPPKIPSTVTNMNSTFYECNLLTEAPKIPSTVTNMKGTFLGCSELTEAPKIPEGVTNMQDTFGRCSALTVVPSKIPDGVTNMSGTFAGCTLLETAPELPSKVTDISGAFAGCSALKVAPSRIPDSVINMSGTFADCILLETVPELPGKVTDISGAFYGCSALTGDLVINATKLEHYEECLTEAATNPGCELKLSGSCPQLDEILGTATSDNVSLK